MGLRHAQVVARLAQRRAVLQLGGDGDHHRTSGRVTAAAAHAGVLIRTAFPGHTTGQLPVLTGPPKLRDDQFPVMFSSSFQLRASRAATEHHDVGVPA